MLMGGIALADTHTWDDGSKDDSYWSTGDNWTPLQVPDTTDDVIIDETYLDSPFTVELRSSDTIADLYMRDGDASNERVTLQIGNSSATTTPVTLTCDDFTVNAPNQGTFVELSRAGSVTATCKVSAATFVVTGSANYATDVIISGGAKIETY